MVVSRKEIQKMIETLPEEKLAEVYTFVKSKTDTKDSEKAFKYVTEKYDKTIKGRVER